MHSRESRNSLSHATGVNPDFLDGVGVGVEVEGTVGVEDKGCKILALAALARWGLVAADEDSASGGGDLDVLDALAGGGDAESVAEGGWALSLSQSSGGHGEEVEGGELHFELLEAALGVRVVGSKEFVCVGSSDR